MRLVFLVRWVACFSLGFAQCWGSLAFYGGQPCDCLAIAEKPCIQAIKRAFEALFRVSATYGAGVCVVRLCAILCVLGGFTPSHPPGDPSG